MLKPTRFHKFFYSKFFPRRKKIHFVDYLSYDLTRPSINIAVIGEGSSGKSKVLASLLGQNYVQPQTTGNSIHYYVPEPQYTPPQSPEIDTIITDDDHKIKEFAVSVAPIQDFGGYNEQKKIGYDLNFIEVRGFYPSVHNSTLLSWLCGNFYLLDAIFFVADIHHPFPRLFDIMLNRCGKHYCPPIFVLMNKFDDASDETFEYTYYDVARMINKKCGDKTVHILKYSARFALYHHSYFQKLSSVFKTEIIDPVPTLYANKMSRILRHMRERNAAKVNQYDLLGYIREMMIISDEMVMETCAREISLITKTFLKDLENKAFPEFVDKIGINARVFMKYNPDFIPMFDTKCGDLINKIGIIRFHRKIQSMPEVDFYYRDRIQNALQQCPFGPIRKLSQLMVIGDILMEYGLPLSINPKMDRKLALLIPQYLCDFDTVEMDQFCDAVVTLFGTYGAVHAVTALIEAIIAAKNNHTISLRQLDQIGSILRVYADCVKIMSQFMALKIANSRDPEQREAIGLIANLIKHQKITPKSHPQFQLQQTNLDGEEDYMGKYPQICECITTSQPGPRPIDARWIQDFK